MIQYFSNRKIRIFLLITVVLTILFLNLHTYRIQVDSLIENTVNKSLTFSRKELKSWPILRPVDLKLLTSSSIVSQLYTVSRAVKSTLILPVFITESYLPIFFNWISHVFLQDSAHLLSHILVVTMDNGSNEIIQHFDIPSIYISPSEFLKHLGYMETMQKELNQIFSIRLICFWLLSGWGFDIIHFDVDAVPVKPNFLDLFIKEGGADLVAGVGTFPNSVKKELGATVCMGTFFLKSLTKSEGVRKLFREMRNVDSSDDQIIMNKALVQMGLSWESSEKDRVWIGWDSSKQLSVHFIPRTLVCRNQCRELSKIRGSLKDRLYIMHPMGQKLGPAKKANLATLGLWNLKSNEYFSSISEYNIGLIEFVEKLSFI